MSSSESTNPVSTHPVPHLRHRKGKIEDTMVPRVVASSALDGQSLLPLPEDRGKTNADDYQTNDERGNGSDPHAKYRLHNGLPLNNSSDADHDPDGIEIETSFTEPLLGITRSSDEDDEGDGGLSTFMQEREHASYPKESSCGIAAQVLLPFLIAGFGTVYAGLVLDHVQHWSVFVQVTELFILVPSLLGLKGNLEMTLASRLSTAANLGIMDDRKKLRDMILGNMALTQCQALVVGFLASTAAVIFGWIPDGEFDINHTLLLCASSMVTASLASAGLGAIMVGVIILSRKCKINPDNVATPIAASLGDLITLSLLAWISNLLFKAIGKQHWLAPTIIVFFFLLVPLWAFLAKRNEYTRDVLYNGWSPVIAAMMISSIGGLVLDIAIRSNEGVAVFSPVINGVGGNLVAVQSSRISTHLHGIGSLGTPDPERIKKCNSPFTVFFGKDMHSRSARVLIMMVIPGQLIFLYYISYMNAGHSSITLRVTFMYITVSLIQVVILFQLADWIVYYLWGKKLDPDNFSIPYLTALGDLLGTALLALGFLIVWLLGDRDLDIGD
ncbi:solute carrier family 41 member 1-like [Lytechinus pictus]|uniref:solute carrier family 41 member 1-like n=1 Tax=Lytechinus pictus TaxID=7653 RepID=UPI00240D997B|nr:solute carrier family 41 member 1-like [Lytechinus pictus]